MFEPTVKRVVAAWSEWDGQQGKARGEDGVLYELDSSQRTDKPFLEADIGDRIEIYLYLDERQQISNITFNNMPSNHVFNHFSGEAFHFQPKKLKKEFIKGIPKFIVSSVFSHRGIAGISLSLFFSNGLWPVYINFIMLFFILLFLIILDYCTHKWDDLAFILGKQGLLVSQYAVKWDKSDYKIQPQSPFYLVLSSEFQKMYEHYGGKGLVVAANQNAIYWADYQDADLSGYTKKDTVFVNIRTDLLSDADRQALEQTIKKNRL